MKEKQKYLNQVKAQVLLKWKICQMWELRVNSLKINLNFNPIIIKEKRLYTLDLIMLILNKLNVLKIILILNNMKDQEVLQKSEIYY